MERKITNECEYTIYLAVSCINPRQFVASCTTQNQAKGKPTLQKSNNETFLKKKSFLKANVSFS